MFLFFESRNERNFNLGHFMSFILGLLKVSLKCYSKLVCLFGVATRYPLDSGYDTGIFVRTDIIVRNFFFYNF